jgi:glycosyltransferase involved in cell wall biosynthesis
MISILINLYNRSDREAFDNYYQEPVHLRLFPRMYKSLQVAIRSHYCEIIVGDWYSTDANVEAIADGAKIIKFEGAFNRSRGKNMLAAAAKYDWLLFLDADMLLPEDFMRLANRVISLGADVWFPHCRYYANSHHTIETDFIRTAFGNMLIRRSIFESMNGFREYDDWGKEDVEFYRRLVQINGRYVIVEKNVEGFYHQWHPAQMRKNIV